MGRRPRRFFPLELDGAFPRRQAVGGRRGGWVRYILSILRAQVAGIAVSPPPGLLLQIGRRSSQEPRPLLGLRIPSRRIRPKVRYSLPPSYFERENR